jgi:hypothetical protein
VNRDRSVRPEHDRLRKRAKRPTKAKPKKDHDRKHIRQMRDCDNVDGELLSSFSAIRARWRSWSDHRLIENVDGDRRLMVGTFLLTSEQQSVSPTGCDRKQYFLRLQTNFL